MWEYLKRFDLASRIVIDAAPVDDPAFHVMVDPRELNAQHRDWLHGRIIDLERLLPMRPYGSEGRVVFEVTDAMVNDFKAFLVARKVKMDEASFAKDETFIRAMIHYEIDTALFSMEEARRNLIAKDPQAQFALAQFGEAEQLLKLSSTRSTRGGPAR